MRDLLHRLWWAVPSRIMSALRRFWHDVRFWLSGIPYALGKTWERFTHRAEDAAILALGFVIVFFVISASDEATKARAVEGLVGAGLALGFWLALVFAWNLVLSYPREHWNLVLALEAAEDKAARLRYQRDFYRDTNKRRLQAAARLLETELRDIQEKVELIEATVAGQTYWDGFAFPASEWQRHRELVADNPDLYAVIERAYTKANRANEIIHQRRTRARPGAPIGRAEEEDLPGVSTCAGDAIAALDALLAHDVPASTDE